MGYVGPHTRENIRERLHLVVGWNNDQGMVSLRRRNKALRNGHDSHFAEFSGSTHAWHALRPLFLAR